MGSTPEHDELAALADGSLDPRRRAELEARMAATPELAALLVEQRRAVELARCLGVDVEAPAGLRARVEAGRRVPFALRVLDRLLLPRR
jgi:anti-sigma factor RsiW